MSQPGRYRLTVRYAARAGWAGRKYVVEFGDQKVNGVVQTTGDWYQYKSFDLGAVLLGRKGPLRVVIHPAEAGHQNLMYFESLRLQPIAAGRT